RSRIIIKSDPNQGAGGLRWLFRKGHDSARAIKANVVVLADLFKTADIVNTQDGSILLAANSTKIPQAFAKEIVACHDDNIVVNLLPLQDEVQVPDGAQLIRIVSRTVIDNGELEAAIGGLG